MDFLFKLISRGAGVNSINAHEAQDKLNQKPAPVLLDVRQPEEYKEQHIVGAKLIPLGELDRRMKELPKEREILVVCHSGSRSIAAARKLNAAGYQPVNIRGGLIAWNHAGLPVKRGK